MDPGTDEMAGVHWGGGNLLPGRTIVTAIVDNLGLEGEEEIGQKLNLQNRLCGLLSLFFPKKGETNQRIGVLMVRGRAGEGIVSRRESKCRAPVPASKPREEEREEEEEQTREREREKKTKGQTRTPNPYQYIREKP